jgi:hypothetical protein
MGNGDQAEGALIRAAASTQTLAGLNTFFLEDKTHETRS